jgi:hypothetical protein
LYKTTQTSRKAFRLGKSVTYYKKLQVLVANKSLTPWQRYLQYIQNTGMVRFTLFALLYKWGGCCVHGVLTCCLIDVCSSLAFSSTTTWRLRAKPR